MYISLLKKHTGLYWSKYLYFILLGILSYCLYVLYNILYNLPEEHNYIHAYVIAIIFIVLSMISFFEIFKFIAFFRAQVFIGIKT